jgi:hypothetical protein
MKRLLITAAMEISLLTLLAACGGDGTDKETPNQEKVRKPPHRPPEGHSHRNGLYWKVKHRRVVGKR